jgi:hypothetical protein
MYSIQELQTYVNRCLPIFGLTQWKVEVSKHPTEEDNWADIEVSDNLWNATLRVSSDFWGLDSDEKRRIVAHELLHVHYSGPERTVESLNGVLGTEAYSLLSTVFEKEIERAADALSTVVARLLPPVDVHSS